jgi:hypothetical protein
MLAHASTSEWLARWSINSALSGTSTTTAWASRMCAGKPPIVVIPTPPVDPARPVREHAMDITDLAGSAFLARVGWVRGR